jgi:hypothetical protein
MVRAGVGSAGGSRPWKVASPPDGYMTVSSRVKNLPMKRGSAKRNTVFCGTSYFVIVITHSMFMKLVSVQPSRERSCDMSPPNRRDCKSLADNDIARDRAIKA